MMTSYEGHAQHRHSHERGNLERGGKSPEASLDPRVRGDNGAHSRLRHVQVPSDG
jgi:hypothetical protein